MYSICYSSLCLANFVQVFFGQALRPVRAVGSGLTETPKVKLLRIREYRRGLGHISDSPMADACGRTLRLRYCARQECGKNGR